MLRKKIKWQAVVVLVCYAVSLVLYLGTGLMRLAADALHSGNGQTQVLHATDFEWGSMVERGENQSNTQLFQMVSTDSDPHLIYQFKNGGYASRLTVQATPNKAIGSMVLYYTTSPVKQGEEPAFTESKKLWAKQMQDGTWYFDLPMNKLYALRLDPDSAGGVIWQFGSFTPLQQRPAASYFALGGTAAVAAVALPAFVAAVGVAAVHMIQEIKGKKEEEPLEE
ncbi:MAG: hypothetical protein ACK5JF_11165 [Oscillospiraceae bacterium]